MPEQLLSHISMVEVFISCHLYYVFVHLYQYMYKDTKKTLKKEYISVVIVRTAAGKD